MKSSIFAYEIITGHAVRSRDETREIGHSVFLYRHVLCLRFIDSDYCACKKRMTDSEEGREKARSLCRVTCLVGWENFEGNFSGSKVYAIFQLISPNMSTESATTIDITGEYRD